MRVDKFLKLSRLIKRRTMAQEMIEVGAVRLNGAVCKSSSEVRENAVLDIAYTARVLKVEVLCADESLLRRLGCESYKVIEERRVSSEEQPW